MELVIGESEEHVFSQEKDPKTGFDEIVITKK
jgi:hypothetical protein